MDVVLLEDVKALGKKGQVVKVSDGYARNYILPKKLGVEATPKNLNELKLQKANAEKVALQQLQAARELGEIARAVEEQIGVELDKKKLVLPEPIKTLGVHQVPVKLHKDVTAQLTVKVEAE